MFKTNGEPVLVLNEEICKRNIKNMADRIRNFGGTFRPHFKTHQSAEVGEWFRAFGVDCITVSSFKMALYFAEQGWKDITVALTTTILQTELIEELAQRINLNILVEDVETIIQLEQKLNHPVGIYIKVDTGYHRTGVNADDLSVVKKLLLSLKDARNLIFIGFLTHAGNTYAAKGTEEVNEVAGVAMQKLLALKVFLKDEFPLMQISWGDTPSCSVFDDFQDIDEFRPGNFVFYDYMQYLIGSCQLKDIAVCLAAPVIALHKDRGEVVVHGGAVHLSKESVKNNVGKDIYGLVVSISKGIWDVENVLGEVKSLSQEHGIISVYEDCMDKFCIGSLVGILPVHSCLTVNLMKKFFTSEGNLITTLQ